MQIFNNMTKYNYEQVVMCHDEESGLKAIICIHDTTLGPACGGTRMWNYENEDDALLDALRLARGMTYKMAAAGLNVGGGKGIIIGDPTKDKNEALFRAYGRFIQSLNGRFSTAEDIGTGPEDLNYVRMETNYVFGLESSSGDPSPVTALGVLRGIEACATEVWGTQKPLQGKVVAVQGVGNVGYALCKLLHEKGAKLIVTDINDSNTQRAVKDFQAEAVKSNEIFAVKCDVFSPCAMGAIINDDTIPQLKCRIVAGGANNQLKEDRHGDILFQKNILHAPDYIINAGGAISICDDIQGNYNRERVLRKVDKIYDTMSKIINIAKKDNMPTYKVADKLAEERIQTVRRLRKIIF